MANDITLNPGAGGVTLSATKVDSFASYSTTGDSASVCVYSSVDTSTAPAPTVKANPLYVQVTNGTQNLPTMDAAARAGFQKITDGTGTLGLDNSNTTAKVSNYGKGSAAGDTAMPSMDTAGHAGFQKITNGTNTAAVGADLTLSTSGAGSTAVSVASGAANTVVKNAAGRLCRVLVTTAGTGSGSVLFYDNATTNSGTVIGVVPATIAIGTYYTFDLPAANGITVANVASGPVLTVSYF